MSQIKITDTWALVTGASGGIGEALAREFSKRGARVVLAARNAEKLQQVANSLTTQTRVVPCDLESAAGVETLLGQVEAEGISIEHLVNNAGFGLAGSFAQLDEARLAQMLELNCVALTLLSRRVLPDMLARGHGGLLQVASVIGFTPTPYMTVYAASKAYVVAFNAALAQELKGSGVHCTALCPGSVATGFQARAGYELGAMERLSQMDPAAVAKIAVNAYARRKTMVAPGLFNSIAAGVLGWVSPSVSAPVVGRVLRALGRGGQ